jgi:sulfatase modifying factor 1
MAARPLLLAALLASASCVPGYTFENVPGDGGADGTVGADAGTHADATSDGPADAPVMPLADAGAGADADASSPPRDAAVAVHVPEGGPLVLQGSTVTLTHAFRLDRYEVTVGRFRAWDSAGRPPPCTQAGQAACNLDPMGPYSGRMVWDPAWNGLVGTSAFAGQGCNDASGTTIHVATYTLGNDALPVSCVNWYQAVSFCAFEGKRIPTETEWEYEASGRGAGRTYAWGNDAPVACAKATWANHDVAGNGCAWPQPAGAASSGGSIDTAFDMSGSLYEWIWDWQAGNYPGGVDYLGPDGGNIRGTRGGSWATDIGPLSVSYRDQTDPLGTYADVGVRCVATIP